MRSLKQAATILVLVAGVIAWSVLLYAAASYPSSVKTFATRTNGQTIAASWFNDIQDEIVAIENDLLAGLPIARGGTHSTTALNNNRVMVSSSGAIVEASALTNGQLLIGSTGAAPVAASVTAGAGVSLTAGAGSLTVAANNFVLLKSGSGTDTSAGATTVDSIAITGLTAKDVLVVYLYLTSVTQATAQCSLYSVTDGLSLALVSVSPLGAGANGNVTTATLMQQQTSATSLGASIFGRDMDAGAAITLGQHTAVTTAWTGSWTLGLRHGGVTAGGTFRYTWVVYKVAGQ